MTKKLTATSRLKQDYLRFKKDPVPYIYAEPLPSNMLEWHYVVKGPEDSPYFGGYYHGTLLFPSEYPFKPPSIYMFTPNGRFKTNTRLCLSISDFHPDTWNPAWSVATILTGLLSFMLESTPTLGSTVSSPYEKKVYARKSLTFNLKNSNFRELFPNIVDEIKELLLLEQQRQNNINNNTNNKNNNNNNNLYLDNNNQQNSNSKNNKNDNPRNNNNNNIKSNNKNITDIIPINNSLNNINESNKGDNNLNNNINNKINSEFYNWQSVCSNVIIILSFAIFALIVNYILKSLNQE